MAGQRAIDMALDLARMPALAPRMSGAPLPADILEVICIAAGAPEVCRAASETTGRSEKVLVDASRFYLQQILFRPDSDCYRVLGVSPDASRASARDHMRWLLQWLHPDHNEGLERVYAKQVVKAWRQVSTSSGEIVTPAPRGGRRRSARSTRLPLIILPVEKRRKKSASSLSSAVIKVAGGLITIVVLLYLFVPVSDRTLVLSEISRLANDCLLAMHW